MQAKYSNVFKELNKQLWYIYTMEYYTAERKKERLPSTKTV